MTRARNEPIGIISRSSWSSPKNDVPRAASTPMTVYGDRPTRTVCPTGSAVPKRFVATVSPMTQTLVLKVSSASVQSAPFATA